MRGSWSRCFGCLSCTSLATTSEGTPTTVFSSRSYTRWTSKVTSRVHRGAQPHGHRWKLSAQSESTIGHCIAPALHLKITLMGWIFSAICLSPCGRWCATQSAKLSMNCSGTSFGTRKTMWSSITATRLLACSTKYRQHWLHVFWTTPLMGLLFRACDDSRTRMSSACNTCCRSGKAPCTTRRLSFRLWQFPLFAPVWLRVDSPRTCCKLGLSGDSRAAFRPVPCAACSKISCWQLVFAVAVRRHWILS
mmetsp:Transcript_19114/g.44885  ORF Transcript_19114/g.44885 Transcript_19114/m.44885 type:complete len:249 (+) Transcript_19114:1029-1775(+)